MTAHELTIALFWMVVAAYVSYVGWSIYSALRRRMERHRRPPRITVLADRTATSAHPVIEEEDAEWFAVPDEDRLAG